MPPRCWFLSIVTRISQQAYSMRSPSPVTSLVTHIFEFERAQEAFDAFAGGTTGKVLLRFTATASA